MESPTWSPAEEEKLEKLTQEREQHNSLRTQLYGRMRGIIAEQFGSGLSLATAIILTILIAAYVVGLIVFLVDAFSLNGVVADSNTNELTGIIKNDTRAISVSRGCL